MLPTSPAAPAIATPPLGSAPRTLEGWLGVGADRFLRFGWPLVLMALLGGAAFLASFAPFAALEAFASLRFVGGDTPAQPYSLLGWIAGVPALTLWTAVACRMSLDVAAGRVPSLPTRFPPLQRLLPLAAVVVATHAPSFLLDVVWAGSGASAEARYLAGGAHLAQLGVQGVTAALLASGLALAPWFVADRGLGPIAAFRAGWRAFAGRRSTLFVAFAALYALTRAVGELVGPLAFPVLSPFADTLLALVYLHTTRGSEAG